MTRTSHDEVMDKLRATPEWRAVSNKDFELAKRFN